MRISLGNTGCVILRPWFQFAQPLAAVFFLLAGIWFFNTELGKLRAFQEWSLTSSIGTASIQRTSSVGWKNVLINAAEGSE